MRYMMLLKLDPNDAPQGGPSAELMEEMGKLLDEMTKAGVLVDTGGLRPEAESTRLDWNRGKLSVTDGPFSEAKEVIGGYAILNASSKEEAAEWAGRFLRLHGEEWSIASEIRQIEEPAES